MQAAARENPPAVTLSQLAPGQAGRVQRVFGGMGMTRRLESLGVRPGKIVRKVSSQLMGGPVTVIVDGRQVAMGRGIASRVQVEIVTGR